MASMPGEGLVHGRMHQWQPQVKVFGVEAYVSGFKVKGFRVADSDFYGLGVGQEVGDECIMFWDVVVSQNKGTPI